MGRPSNPSTCAATTANGKLRHAPRRRARVFRAGEEPEADQGHRRAGVRPRSRDDRHPCPLCQANVEIYQGEINKKNGTKFAMPVTCYSQLMTLAHGGGIKEAGLDGHVIRAKKLEEIAVKVA